LVLLDSMVEVLAGAAPDRPAYARPGRGVPAEVPAAAADDHEPEAGTQYEVMYSLTHTDDARADELRSALRALGDSVVVVGDGGTGDRARWAVHVHTDLIGPAIEAALPLGRVSEIRVTDMLDPVGTHHSHSHRHGDADERVPAAPERTVLAMTPSGPLAELFEPAGARTVGRLPLPGGERTGAQPAPRAAAGGGVDRHVLPPPPVWVARGLAALAAHPPPPPLSSAGWEAAAAAAAARHAHLVRAEQEAL